MVDRVLNILVATSSPGDVDALREALGFGQHVIRSTASHQLLDLLDASVDCDCVLIKVASPGGIELQIIPELKRHWPNLPILAYGNQWQIASVVQAIKIGADEVCEFPGQVEELTGAIKRILISAPGRASAYADLIPKSILQILSSEEARILHLLVQGRTTKEVGATLDVSIRTVHYRKKEMLRKLGVQNRSEAIELIRISTGNLFGGLAPSQL